MREMTRRRELALKELVPHFTFVSINECEFDEMYNNDENKVLKEQLDLEIETTFMQPRSFYFGGRVNAIVLKDKCQPGFEMKYNDFTSLYPAVMKTERYPLGNFIYLFNNL
jgi:DNA polymerase type B, organellar and viral